MTEIIPEMLTMGAAAQVTRSTIQFRDVGMTFWLAQVSARECVVWISRVSGFRFVSARPRLLGAIMRVPVFWILEVSEFNRFASAPLRP